MEHYSWILQVILALFFTMPGIMKIQSSKEALVGKGKMKPDDSIVFIRILGISEILGVLAMIIPIWIKELQILTAIAAAGFAVIMVGALAVHYKKREYKLLPVLLFALLLSVLVFIYNI